MTTGDYARVRLPVRWDDVDAAGVIFFGNYFRIFQLAEEELFRARGKSLHDVLSEFKIWVPRVETHATFLNPARFGDTIEVLIRVCSMGQSSIRYEYEVEKVDPHPVIPVVRGYTVIVCVSQDTFRPVPIPPRLRELFGGKTVRK